MWETWGESDSARGQNKYSSLSWLFWKNPQCLEKCTSVGRFPTKYLSWPKFWFWQPKKLLNPMTVVVQYHSTHTNSSFLCVFSRQPETHSFCLLFHAQFDRTLYISPSSVPVQCDRFLVFNEINSNRTNWILLCFFFRALCARFYTQKRMLAKSAIDKYLSFYFFRI